MADNVIGDYTAAVTIDGSTHYLLIQPGSASTAYRKINRNVLLGVTGQPADISTSQNITNKTLDNTNTITLKDTLFTLQDDGDTTKQAKFQLSGITTATTRTYTLPNASSTLADIATAQTFTNKTLTSPVITGGSISNSTIAVDAIAEFTPANGVTVDGLNIKDGKLNTNNSVVTANITNASVTPNKLATGAVVNFVSTSETTASTSYVNLATVQSLTVTVGANGLLLVGWSAQMSNSGANSSSCAVTLSGTNTYAASNNDELYALGTNQFHSGITKLFSGLNTGSTTVTLQFSVSAGTGTFLRRQLWVLPL